MFSPEPAKPARRRFYAACSPTIPIEKSASTPTIADPAEEFQGYGLVDGKAVSVSLLPTERRLAGKLIYGRNQLSLLSVQDSRRPITDTVRVVLRDFPFASLGTARFDGERLGQRAGGYQGRLGWFSHMHARAKDTVLNSGVMQILHK